MKNKLSTVVLVMTCLFQLTAQEPFDFVEFPDTLSFRNTKAFVIDDNGNKWLGSSQYGLLKYNTNTFELYNTENSDLPSNNIRSLFYADNKLYVGTIGAGLAILSDNNWTVYNTENGLVGNYIYDIGVFEANIYLGTNKGLSIYDGTSWDSVTMNNSNLKGERVMSVCHDNIQNLFFSTIDTNYQRSLNIVSKNLNLTVFETNEFDYVYKIFKGRNDEIIISSQQGHFKYNNGNPEIFLQNEDWTFTSSENVGYIEIMNSYYSILGGMLYLTNGSTYETYNTQSSNCYLKVHDETIWLAKGVIPITYRSLCKFYPQHYLSLYHGRGISTYQNYKYLNVNNVNAGYHNRGDMFMGKNITAEYEVPADSGKHSIFASGFWVGTKYNDEIKGAFRTYIGNYDAAFLPGPLKVSGNEQGTTDSLNASQYDKIWKVDRQQIEEFKLNFELGNIANGSYKVPDAIATWPAHGAEGYAQDLAPFIDVNEDNVYNPISDGDYPEIKGDQMLYWIFNDQLAAEFEPMQVEIHASAYASVFEDASTDSIDAINHTTFLNFKVYNRSANDYDTTYIGYWSDFDLGDPDDDKFGAHVKLNSYYVYNGREIDGDGSGMSYGANPPAQAVSLLQNTTSNHRPLYNFIAYNRGSGVFNSEPQSSEDYFNYLTGRWNNGMPMTYGVNGYGNNVECRYLYPGNSDPTGLGTNNIPQEPWYCIDEFQDAPCIGSQMLTDFSSGKMIELDIALVWTRGSNGVESSIDKLFRNVANVNQWFSMGEIPSNYNFDISSVKNSKLLDNVKIYPNPTKGILNVDNGSDTEFFIYNLSGQLIKKGAILSKNQILNISTLDCGLYLIKLVGKNTLSVHKFYRE